jgi:hypothetical protein
VNQISTVSFWNQCHFLCSLTLHPQYVMRHPTRLLDVRFHEPLTPHSDGYPHTLLFPIPHCFFYPPRSPFFSFRASFPAPYVRVSFQIFVVSLLICLHAVPFPRCTCFTPVRIMGRILHFLLLMLRCTAFTQASALAASDRWTDRRTDWVIDRGRGVISSPNTYCPRKEATKGG